MAEKKRRTSAAWGGPRVGAGRPPLPPNERQDATILVRLLPRELERLRALAAEASLGAGQYVREVLRRHLARATHVSRSRRKAHPR